MTDRAQWNSIAEDQQRQTLRSSSADGSVIGVSAVLVLCLGSFRLGVPSLWGDETVSVVITESGMLSLFRTAAEFEASGSLYYLLLSVWQGFGNSQWTLGSLSVMIAVLTIPVLHLLACGRKDWYLRLRRQRVLHYLRTGNPRLPTGITAGFCGCCRVAACTARRSHCPGLVGVDGAGGWSQRVRSLVRRVGHREPRSAVPCAITKRRRLAVCIDSLRRRELATGAHESVPDDQELGTIQLGATSFPRFLALARATVFLTAAEWTGIVLPDRTGLVFRGDQGHPRDRMHAKSLAHRPHRSRPSPYQVDDVGSDRRYRRIDPETTGAHSSPSRRLASCFRHPRGSWYLFATPPPSSDGRSCRRNGRLGYLDHRGRSRRAGRQDWRQAISVESAEWEEGDLVVIAPSFFLPEVASCPATTTLSSPRTSVCVEREFGVYRGRDDAIDLRVGDLETIEASRIWHVGVGAARDEATERTAGGAVAGLPSAHLRLVQPMETRQIDVLLLEAVDSRASNQEAS